MVASDYRDELLRTVRASRDMLPEGPRAALSTAQLDWEEEAAALGRCEATLSDAFDVVLAAEVIYEPEHPRLVARTIARRLRLDAAASAGLAEDTNETGDSGESTSCRAPPTALLALSVRSARRLEQVREEIVAAGLELRAERELFVDDDVLAMAASVADGEGVDEEVYVGCDLGVGKCAAGAAGGGFVLLEAVRSRRQ